MKKPLKNSLSVFAACVLLSVVFIQSQPVWAAYGNPITVSNDKFFAGGTRIWINGANTPWKNWNDFGGNFNYDWWDNHFQELRQNGINATRVWISCDGEVGINIDDSGYVSGATPQHWADLDSLFQIAQNRGVYIKATLMSFDHFKNSHPNYMKWRNWLQSNPNIDSYVNNYLIPFINRYGNNSYFFSIDFMNEPDWVAENAECGQISWDWLQTYFAKASVAVHTNSNILTTVDICMIKYLSSTVGEGNKVSDSALMAKVRGDRKAKIDYYTLHPYDLETVNWGDPFYMTPQIYGVESGKPVIMGEIPAIGTSGHTITDEYEYAYLEGWQGVMAWTSNGVDENGSLFELGPATSAFMSNHSSIVFPNSEATTDACASFNSSTNTLHIPALTLGGALTYWVDLSLLFFDNIRFRLANFGENNATISGNKATFYGGNRMSILVHCLNLGENETYWLDLGVSTQDNQIQFNLNDFGMPMFKDVDHDGYSDGTAWGGHLIPYIIEGRDFDDIYDIWGDRVIGTGDLDDNDPTIHPGATDIPGDRIDQDCDGTDAVADITWYKDFDRDGYSDGTAVRGVHQPSPLYFQATELNATSGDLDDNDSTIHPTATEIPGDGIDQDCDGRDVSPPSITSVDTPGVASRVQIVGSYAYVADGSGRLQVIDISNPTSPVIIGSYVPPHYGTLQGQVWDVKVVGPYAYIANDWVGLTVIDISNPSSPTYVGHTGPLNFGLAEPIDIYHQKAICVQVVGSYGYVTCGTFFGLQVIDLSNPTSPTPINSVFLGGNGNRLVYNNDVFIAGSYAYVTCLERGLVVIDISNPASLTIAGEFETEGSAQKVQVVGPYAYVANGRSGLAVIDTRDLHPSGGYYRVPFSGVNVATYGDAWGVHVVGSRAYVADGNAGLAVIDISNPMSPRVVVSVDTPGIAHDVYVSGSYAYVADGEAGLQIINLNFDNPGNR